MPETNPKKLSRRHHYLPQMYLRGFADEDDLVWVYERQKNSYLHQGVVNTADKKDFYTIVGSDGQKTDEVETLMANMVEGPVKHIIERLDKRNLTWEGEDRAILALFVALLQDTQLGLRRTKTPSRIRVPPMVVESSSSLTGSSREIIARIYEEKTGEDMTDVSPQELFEMIRDDHFEFKNPRQNNVKMMMSLSLEVAKTLFRLNWEILAAPKGMSFVTCDNPFTVVLPPFFDDTLEGYGILTPGASTVVPLSHSRTAICFHGEGERTRGAVVYKDFLRHTNVVVAANSERFVIAREEPLLRSIVRKGKLDQWQPGPRLKMNVPDPYALKPSEIRKMTETEANASSKENEGGSCD